VDDKPDASLALSQLNTATFVAGLPMATISVRAGRILDLAALARLTGDVQALHFANRPDQFKPVDPDGIERWLVALLQSPSANVWVAEQDGTLVGYAAVAHRERAATPFCMARAWWDLEAMGVSAEHRRKGVGRALLQRVVSEAKAQGIAEIELNSWAFNAPAQAAFRSLGFTPKALRFELRVSDARSTSSP
jgi:GNAT superfamily N-acetyltransferase